MCDNRLKFRVIFSLMLGICRCFFENLVLIIIVVMLRLLLGRRVKIHDIVGS